MLSSFLLLEKILLHALLVSRGERVIVSLGHTTRSGVPSQVSVMHRR